jgi:hypothetical protein
MSKPLDNVSQHGTVLGPVRLQEVIAATDTMRPPSRCFRAYHYPFWASKGALLVSVIEFGAAMIVFRQRLLISQHPVWLGSLKIAAGAVLLFQSGWTFDWL